MDFRERKLGGISLKYLDVTTVLQNCQSEGTLPQEFLQSLSRSDLLPGVYEGGFKIWDCAWDLCSFVSQLQLTGKNVLEIGCGAGLPGIACLLCGAKSVTFQDFNREVLDQLTRRNVILNGNELAGQSAFVSGDWTDVASQLLNNSKKFDIVVTSETIYQPKSYQKLTDLIASVLRPDGVAYVAAKLYYFGVDGSAPEFEGFVQKNTKFSVKEVLSTDTDIPRVILEVRWRDS